MNDHLTASCTIDFIQIVLKYANDVHCNNVRITHDGRDPQISAIDSIICELNRKGESLMKRPGRKSNKEYIDLLNKKKQQIMSPNYYEASPRKLFFRGVSNESYMLIPSIMRYTDKNLEEFRFESFYYKQIEVMCPDAFAGKSHFDHISMMQHYGCPTRLLDITSNPLVALYFACKRNKDHNNSNNGIVYVFAPRENELLAYDNEKVVYLSSIAALSNHEKDCLYKACCQALMDGVSLQGNENEGVLALFNELSKEHHGIDHHVNPIDLLSIYYVQPTHNNRRLEKQDGAFILSGLARNFMDICCLIQSESVLSITITNQDTILRELELLGINETSLFPEIESVAHYLKEKQKIFMMDGSIPV